MDQSFDARGKATTGGIDARGNALDARGNPAVEGIDARGIDGQPGEPRCPQCGTPLRASGPGRRPVYCSRSCSSKAYRQRRTEGHQDAVADALVSSRVEIPAAVDAGARELLELAAAVQRATARYLHNLDQARHGQGDDPRCNRALQQLETSTTSATQRLLRQAHVLRYEMTDARNRAERAAAATAPAAPPAGPGANLVPTRVESPDPAAVDLVPTRVETSRPGADAVPNVAPAPDGTVPGHSDAAPAPRPSISTRVETPGPATSLVTTRVESTQWSVNLVSPRVETPDPHVGAAPQPIADRPLRSIPTPQQSAVPGSAARGAASVGALHSAVPDPATVRQPAPADPVPGLEDAAASGDGSEQLPLALADERTSISPLARGLGAPTSTQTSPDGTLTVESWDHDPRLHAVRDTDRRLLGWVQELRQAHQGRPAWGAFIDGRLVIDPTDNEPVYFEEAPYAVSLLQAALDQHLL